MKKNAKKFAYIKKKLYLCTRFRKDTRNDTKKITQLETQKFRDYEQDLQHRKLLHFRDERYQH